MNCILSILCIWNNSFTHNAPKSVTNYLAAIGLKIQNIALKNILKVLHNSLLIKE